MLVIPCGTCSKKNGGGIGEAWSGFGLHYVRVYGNDVFVFVHISYFLVFAIVYIHHASGRKFDPLGLSR
jgi:hypothetical protein